MKKQDPFANSSRMRLADPLWPARKMAPVADLQAALCHLAVILTLLIACGMAAAAKAAPKAAEFPGAVTLLQDQIRDLENRLADLAIQRPDTPTSAMPALEMNIDLRVIARWMFQHAADAKPQSEEQFAGYLRGVELLHAADALNDLLKQTPRPFTRSQNEALARLHQTSYALPESAKSISQLDDLSSLCGALILNIANPAPVDFKKSPPMRPKPIPLTQPARSTHPAGHRTVDAQSPRTVTQLADEIRQATIGVALRKQLLALADQAKALALTDQAMDRNKTRAKEYAELSKALEQSVDLAKGLAANTAVTPDDRQQIESTLAEGIALFSDPRTRKAGRQRLDSLHEYRQTLARIGGLALTDDQKKALGPLFTWARDNPKAGYDVMNAVAAYASLAQRFDQWTGAGPSGELFQTEIESLKEQFTRHRGQFMNDAVLVPRQLMLGADAGTLGAHVAEMTHELKTMDLLSALPDALKVLETYRPRPHGALRTTILAAGRVAVSPVRSPARTDALHRLDSVVRLARAADGLSKQTLDSVPPEVSRVCTGGQLEAFEAKWKSMIGDLATAAATPAGMDAAALDRLEKAGDLYAALRTAAVLAQVFENWPLLSRWVDWTVPSDQLQSLLLPYRDALAAAFGGFIHDSSARLDQWQSVENRYQPLVTLLMDLNGYADQCKALPQGIAGNAARLLTPLNNAPFATEHYASFALAAWGSCRQHGDAAAADAAALSLGRGLAHQLKIPYHTSSRHP